jgi:hypothetical protein
MVRSWTMLLPSILHALLHACRAWPRLSAGLRWDQYRRRIELELGVRLHNLRTRVMSHVNEMGTVFSEDFEDAYGVLYERWEEQRLAYAELQARIAAGEADADEADEADVWYQAHALRLELRRLHSGRNTVVSL